MSSSDLSGKIALVTGSSTGIGAGIAKELAKQGATVIVHGRSPSSELDQTRHEIEQLNSTVNHLCCDFTKTNDVVGFAEDAWNVHGHLHIVVNNAGGDVLTGSLADLSTCKKLDYLYSVDCRSTLMLSQTLGEKMKSTCGDSTGEHAIVNIGWDQALQGMAGESGEVFSTIKGSVMAMTLSLAQTLAPQVRVNCVAPGWIQTQWGRQASEYWSNRARNESLMDRWGTEQDVANAVAFLVSNRASFISGQILNVNGGFRFNYPGQSQ